MPELKCKECSSMMDSEVHLPRMLFCGHTYCSKCLKRILVTRKSCPSCNTSVVSKNVKEYPVNMPILKQMSSLNSTIKTKEQHLVKVLKIKRELEVLKPGLQSMVNKIESAKKCEEQLNELMETTDGSVNEETTDKINELEEIVKEIGRQIHVPPNPNIILNVSLRSEDYDSALDYIAEIQNGIQVKNQKFAAVLRIDGVKKFARLSISENLFFIHAFDTHEDDSDIVTVCFQDLFTGLLRCDLLVHGFLELTHRSGAGGFHRKAIIDVSNYTSSSSFVTQFLKLCTGESGSSLKDLEYSQEYESIYCIVEHIIQLDRNSIKPCASSKHSSSQNSHLTSVPYNSSYLACTKDGLMEIIQYGPKPPSNSSKNIPYGIGPIIDFNGDFGATFKDATLRPIRDCGIAFKL